MLRNEMMISYGEVTKQDVYLALKRFIANRFPHTSTENTNKKVDTDTEYLPNFETTNRDIKHTTSIDPLIFEAREWRAKVYHEIWMASKIQCNWEIGKKHQLNNELTLTGKCSFDGCKCRFFAQTYNGRTKLQINITNFDERINHPNRKRRHKVEENILHSVATIGAGATKKVRAASMMNPNDQEPLHLNNAGSLRAQMCRSKSDLYLDKDATMSLRKMQDMPQFHNCISNIGLAPFKCTYVSPMQTEWAKAEMKGEEVVIETDATGLKLMKPASSERSEKTQRLKPIFLYSVILQGSKNLPILQVLSQQHDHLFIYEFLRRYFWTVVKKMPKESIFDGSKAIMLANIQAFTRHDSVVEYSNACFNALFNGGKVPDCFIRLDRYHLVKNIMTAKWLKAVGTRERRLIQNVLGFIIESDNIKDVKQTIDNLFKLILNKYIHSKEIEKAKENVKSIVHTHKLKFDEPDVKSEEKKLIPDDSFLNDDDLEESLFEIWLRNILQNVEENHVNDLLNASIDTNQTSNYSECVYFVEENNKTKTPLKESLIKFLKKLPFISNIMTGCFGSTNLQANTGATESSFKNLKNSILSNKSNVRVDGFVAEHINMLNGEFLLTLANEKPAKKLKTDLKATATTTITNKFKLLQEPWMNKNPDAWEEKRRRFSRKDNSILNPKAIQSTRFPMLPLGSKTQNKRNTITTSNTCPFDSLASVFTAAYCDIASFKRKVDEDKGDFAKMLTQLAAYQIPKACKMRDIMLTKLIKDGTTLTQIGETFVNAKLSINTMFMRICKENPMFCSMKTKFSCLTCDYKSDSKDKIFLQTDLSSFDYNDVQNSVVEVTARDAGKKCPLCSGHLVVLNEFNEVVCIDLEGSLPSKDGKGTIEAVDFKNDITNQIELGGVQYKLRAIVDFDDQIEHFRANILRNTWNTYDDMLSTHVQKTPKKLKAVLLVYSILNDKELFNEKRKYK